MSSLRQIAIRVWHATTTSNGSFERRRHFVLLAAPAGIALAGSVLFTYWSYNADQRKPDDERGGDDGLAWRTDWRRAAIDVLRATSGPNRILAKQLNANVTAV